MFSKKNEQALLLSRRRVLAGAAALPLLAVPGLGTGVARASALSRGAGTTTSRDPAPPAPPVIPAQSVSVADFGGKPNDGQDDTAAIQAAIDSIAARGGGTVWFDPGVYQVSIAADTGTSVIVRSNVRLAATTSGSTTIRLADGQGDYYAIFKTTPGYSPPPGYTGAHDMAMEGLVLDQNALNNPVHASGLPFGDRAHNRSFIWYNTVERIAFKSCRFTNSYSISGINVYGSDVSVQHCVFDQVGGSEQDYDHSTFYIVAQRVLVEHNTFTSRFGAGTRGVATAMEMHGNDWLVQHNVVDGFCRGMNVVAGVVSTDPTSDRQVVMCNKVMNAMDGMMLWHANIQQVSGPTLMDTTITHNTISLDTVGWAGQDDTQVPPAGSPIKSPRVGIQVHPTESGGIDGLVITDNSIDFGDICALAQDRNFVVDSWSGGVVFEQLTNYEVSNFDISRNTVTNALSSGVWSTATMTSGSITDNVFVNPGSNGYFNPPKGDYGYPLYQDAYRTGVYLGGQNTNVTVADNQTQTRPQTC